MGRSRAAKTEVMVADCYAILKEIQPASVRAVCYQLFVLNHIPDMSRDSTTRISRILVGARERGEIPWSWIVDEHRNAERVAIWDDPEEFAEGVLSSYRRDRWLYQPRQIEVWSEKGTVRGTLRPVLEQYGITLRVMHGFSSATVVHAVAEESKWLDAPLLVFYVGDYDPSGLHMSQEDLPRRLKEYGGNVEIRRLALTIGDVGTLPSFPAADKKKDPRHRWFAERYGNRCWELDAMSPAILRQKVARAIYDEIDTDEWDRIDELEAVERESLVEVMTGWKNTVPEEEETF